MKVTIGRVLFCSLLFFAGPAFSYQLGDHEAITRQAYKEFSTCAPEIRTKLDVESLVAEDLDEDLNLVEKELFFSHYYNPEKNLNMWRSDSMDRIRDLLPELNLCRATAGASADEFARLGHAIHHIQDATAPPHVVPITHSFWDGFENTAAETGIDSGWSCTEILLNVKSNELRTILKETAQITLDSVRKLKLNAINLKTRGPNVNVSRGTDPKRGRP